MIAPDTILTAAHVLKNKTKDPLPYLTIGNLFCIMITMLLLRISLFYSSFEIHGLDHPGRNPPYGDGDRRS